MKTRDIDDLLGQQIYDRTKRSHQIRFPVVSVVQIPSGPDRGSFAVMAHGKNDINEMTIVELAVYKTFDEARLIFMKLQAKEIVATDIPGFEITPTMLLTWKQRYAKLLV